MAPRVVQGRNLAPRSAKPAVLHNYKLYFSHIGGAVQLLSLPILLVGVDNLPVSLVAPHFNMCGSCWNRNLLPTATPGLHKSATVASVC